MLSDHLWAQDENYTNIILIIIIIIIIVQFCGCKYRRKYEVGLVR